MRWLALLGGVFLLVVWLVLREAPQPPQVHKPEPAPTATAPAATAPPAPVAAAPAPAIVLRGLLFRGDGSDQSQALLAVAGGPAHLYRAGETVDQGWQLETIAQDHAVIARNGERTRLAVVADAGAAALSVAAASAPKKDTPLPGFAKGPAPAAVTSLEPSKAENRRFLQDRAQRRSGAGSAPR